MPGLLGPRLLPLPLRSHTQTWLASDPPFRSLYKAPFSPLPSTSPPHSPSGRTSFSSVTSNAALYCCQHPASGKCKPCPCHKATLWSDAKLPTTQLKGLQHASRPRQQVQSSAALEGGSIPPLPSSDPQHGPSCPPSCSCVPPCPASAVARTCTPEFSPSQRAAAFPI